MARTLTLSQIRESARFAWHGRGYLFVDDMLLRAVRMEPPAAGGNDGVLHVSRSTLQDEDAEKSLGAGWQHLEGCDCVFCSQEGPVNVTPLRLLPPEDC